MSPSVQPGRLWLPSPHDLSKLSNLDCIARPAAMAPAANSTVEPAATQVHFRPSHQPLPAPSCAGLDAKSMFAGTGAGLVPRSGFAGDGGGTAMGSGAGSAATGIANGRSRRVTVPTEAAVTSTFSSAGIVFSWLAVI